MDPSLLLFTQVLGGIASVLTATPHAELGRGSFGAAAVANARLLERRQRAPAGDSRERGVTSDRRRGRRSAHQASAHVRACALALLPWPSLARCLASGARRQSQSVRRAVTCGVYGVSPQLPPLHETPQLPAGVCAGRISGAARLLRSAVVCCESLLLLVLR